jgi:hypothetical protein
MKTNSRVATGEVNHQSRLYTFSEFIEPDSSLLLTHADESSMILLSPNIGSLPLNWGILD